MSVASERLPQGPSELEGESRHAAAAALARAIAYLREEQHEAGWWKGELETNVTMDAEDLLLREFLGIRTPEETEQAAAWIRSQQRDDGTWANFYGGPGDLSTTIEAYIALRLAGDDADAPHHRQGGRVDPRGGRGRAPARLHPDLAGAVRAVVVGRAAEPAAGDHLPAAVVSAQRLRLGVLGSADDRPAHHRHHLAAAADAPGGHRRAAHRRAHSAVAAGPVLGRLLPAARPGAARLREAAGAPASPGGDAPRRRLDRRPAGGRRRLGRHPAAVGLLAARAAAERATRSTPR